MSRRVLVCGGRDLQDYYLVSKALLELHEAEPFSLIIHGGCTLKGGLNVLAGADGLADRWARAMNIPLWVFQRTGWHKAWPQGPSGTRRCSLRASPTSSSPLRVDVGQGTW